MYREQCHGKDGAEGGAVDAEGGAMVDGLGSHNDSNMAAEPATIRGERSELTLGVGNDEASDDESRWSLADIMRELLEVKAMISRRGWGSYHQPLKPPTKLIMEEMPQLALTVEEAVTDQKRVRGRCQKWLQDKGFGFCVVDGQTVFVHSGAVRLRGHLLVGSHAILKVIQDPSQGPNRWKATEAWLETDFEEEQARVASRRKAEEVEAATNAAAVKAAEARELADCLELKVRKAMSGWQRR
jgi:cold shock CspA family protein